VHLGRLGEQVTGIEVELEELASLVEGERAPVVDKRSVA
jgi:hypothetical protein